jgi:hypothetical protein
MYYFPAPSLASILSGMIRKVFEGYWCAPLWLTMLVWCICSCCGYDNEVRETLWKSCVY